MKYGAKRRALNEKAAATSASTRVWKALADPTRRRIFEKLANGASQVGDLASGLPVTRSAVSQHLRVLKDAGLVEVERMGRTRIPRPRCAGAIQRVSRSDRFPDAGKPRASRDGRNADEEPQPRGRRAGFQQRLY